MAIGIKAKIIVFVFLITLLVAISTSWLFSTGVIDYTSAEIIWGYGLGVAFLVGIIGASFSYYLFRPIEQLIIASQLLAAGRYDQNIKTRRKDEFGRLVEAFNSMGKKLKTATAKSREYSDMIAQEKCKTDHIIDSMTEGVIVTDVNYKIVLFNSTAQQIFQLEEEKIRNKHIIHFFKAFGMEMAIEKFPALEKDNVLPMKNVSPTVNEIRINKPKKMVLKVSIAPVLNEKKFPSGMVIVIDDITRRKEIEDMKTEFVSNVSHELRTPLTSILGYTSVLLNEKQGELNDKQKKSLATVQMESQRLSKIIEDLLDLSRLESKRANLRFEPINLVEVLNKTQAVNFPKNKGIKFEIIAPAKLPNVNADKTKMTQVFTNLISNAVKFTKEKGKITIKFTNHKNCIQVDVADTGIGIKKDEIPKLFSKFYQVESHLTKQQSGTGLGLAIVKEIIGLHYGLLAIQSRYNKGTKISFTIPKKKQKENPLKENCWEKLSCGKTKCPAYRIENNRCWLELGTLCKKKSQEPCYDKIKVCSYCDIYNNLFEAENNEKKDTYS